MMNIKGIFAVSLIAMVAMVAGAHTSNAVAAIASKGYVDQQVGSKLSSISGSTTGSGNVVTSVSASGSTVSATKGITAEETKNKVKSVRAADSATDTAYPSEKAVATALAGKANTSALSGYATTTALGAVEDKAEAAQSAASAAQNAADAKVATEQGTDAMNKAVITNSSGTITTGQIASGMIANDAVTADKIADGVIPTVNNATLTIQKNGDTVDTFTANASANKTINITVPTKTSQLTNDSDFITAEQLPDEYTLPVATEDTLGGVKSGGDITVDTSGTVTVKSAGTAITAKNATNDAEGKDIILTYAKKSDIPTASDILTATTVTSSGTGAVLTGVSVTDGKVTLQKGNVQIPSGGQNATSYVSIWVE